MHHGVPRSSPTPTTDQRADAGQEPGSTPATTVPAATVPTTTAPPASQAPSMPAPTTTAAPTTAVPTTTVVAVVDVAGPPVPAAFQQFGVGGSGSSSATSGSSASSSTAVVAAKGPLPSQALPATGTDTFEAAGVATLLLVVGLVAVRISQVSRAVRRRCVDPV